MSISEKAEYIRKQKIYRKLRKLKKESNKTLDIKNEIRELTDQLKYPVRTEIDSEPPNKKMSEVVKCAQLMTGKQKTCNLDMKRYENIPDRKKAKKRREKTKKRKKKVIQQKRDKLEVKHNITLGIENQIEELKKQIKSPVKLNIDPEIPISTFVTIVQKAPNDQQKVKNKNKLKKKLNMVDKKLKNELEKNKMLKDRWFQLSPPQHKDSYKCLKSIGLEQISSALEWKGTSVEDVQNKARMHYEKIREITSVLEDDFEELIEEKLNNGAFRATIKEEILKFIQGRNSINGEVITENILPGTNKFPFIKEEIITTDNEDRISQKSKSSEASEKSKSSEVSEKSKSSEASGKSESNMTEESRSNEVSEKSKSNKTEESKSNGASEKSKSIEASEKSKSNVTPEKNKLSKALEENKSNKTLKKNESSEVPEKSKSSVTPVKNKLSKALEENKSNKALEKNESNEVPEKNKSREATEKNKSHETPEKNKPSETPEINKPSETPGKKSRETPEKKSRETPEKNHSNGSLHSDSFLEELSLSSVHTSDLSSFDDEISISSEEGNEKRRVSLKFAADEIERVRQVKAVENQRKRKKTMNGNNRVPSSDSGSSTETSVRRVRKPNSKYFSNDVLSPFDVAEFGTGTNIKKEIDNAAPRKRGRPRKHLSD